MNRAWLTIALFSTAIVIVLVSQARARAVSKRRKTVNIGIILMCIGGIGSALPTVLNITSPEVRSTATVFNVCCTLLGFFFLLRQRND
jgi:hypothetical protein